jgi:signal transduction histidine kinase/DNA-binding response OmpR family regulator
MGDSDGSRAVAPPGGPVPAPFDLDTEFGRALAAVDWAASPVGPWQQWPASLTNTVRLMTGSRFAMWMAWGDQLTFFCNDDYRRDTLGAKYPWALGRPAPEVWSEIWPDIGPRIDKVISSGVATWDEGLQLFLERSGYVEETYHTFSYSPVTDDDGRIAGLFCVVSEDTRRVIGERRIALLRDLGAALSGAATEADVNAAAQSQLATDPYDLPFALSYLYDKGTDAATLRWTSGLAFGSPLAPPVLRRGEVHVWTDALFADEPDVQVIDLSAFPDVPRGGWIEPALQAMAVPLHQVGERDPYGYLVVGLNRYREFDDDYEGFVELVAGQLSSAIARAQAFEAERERNDQLAELDRAKTAFFTNVSHELRTPLTLLLGPAQDALADSREPLPAGQRRRVEVIERNGERLLKLVNTLLDFSRLASDRMTARYEQLDLSRFTVELASMFESAFERSDLRLVIDCMPLPERPYVDREMWSKIVLNLVSNALKATFTGEVTVRLRPAAEGGAVLEVRDTGVGIAADELDRLFERFHRVSGAQLRSHEGSGIGLALVAELARLHGGDVGVESEPGRGSTFTVRLPAGRAHLPADQVHDEIVDELPDITRYGAGYLAESLRWATDDDEAPAETAAEPGRPRILVVDDNPDMREYIRTLLGQGYDVQVADNGARALQSIAERAPDLVLTDVMMPVLDGFGLLAAIRDNPATMHLPVVMLSARSGDDATVEGLEAGADDYLVKPFSARELLARVRSNLELDRVRRVLGELERSQQLLDNAEASAQIGSFEIDLRSGTVRMSPELFRISGLTAGPDSTIGFDEALATVDPDDAVSYRAALERAVAEGAGGLVDEEVRATRTDGTHYLARIRGTVALDDHGVARYVRGSTQDITEQRAAEIQLAAAHADREAAAREHAIASELQRSLLPDRDFVADNLEVASFYRAGVEGTEVGGDWFDVIEVGMGRTAVVIGDVMGRGVKAAAVMGQLRAATRAYSRLSLPPAELMRLLDDTVREISEDTIVTCVYAVYDPADSTLEYANAGHLPPLVTSEGAARRLSAGGPPLGAGRHGDVSETVPLPPGSLLTLYTDGLVERRGSDLDAGIDQLATLITSSLAPLAQLPAALADALLPEGPDDDVAVLVCFATERVAGEQSARHALLAGERALVDARAFVAGCLREWGVDQSTLFDAQIAVSELATNAIHHGAPPIEVQVRLTGRCLRLEVRDRGDGNPAPRRSGPDAADGRGLFIVATLADRWGTEPGRIGKVVWCEFDLAPPAGPTGNL